MTAYWVTLAVAIVASMAGQILLKSGATGEGGFLVQLLRPATIIGLGFYGRSLPHRPAFGTALPGQRHINFAKR